MTARRRQEIDTYKIAPNLTLMDLCPPIPGYERFIGSYLAVGEKKAVIDTGPKSAVPNLLKALGELGAGPGEIDYVILTHIHLDHGGGIGTAMQAMPRAKVIAHGRARAHLIDPTQLWAASLKTLGQLALQYGDIEPVAEDRIVVATDAMKLDLGQGVVLEIYITPGHAPHHLSIFDRASGLLIAGEAAGVCIDGTLRPATPPPFKMDEMLASIDRLISLEPRRLCYGHFGCYDNAPERLRAYRQKLLEWREIVRSVDKPEKSSEDVLAMLRQKDPSLNYLDRLTKDEYVRERALFINSINGLREPKMGG